MAYTCFDCPRNCGAVRNEYSGDGFCAGGTKIPVAKVMTHLWEEPVLAKDNGTSNIFLYGCNLRCRFCQNSKINGSALDYDKKKLEYYDNTAFSELLLKLNDAPTNNVGIVSGDHYIRQIAGAITENVKKSLTKPIIFNGNGYNKPELLSLLEGKIDIFMPDLKFSSGAVSDAYCAAPDYPDYAKAAVKKMFEMTGPVEFTPDGLLKKGVIIRHLIMPSRLRETFAVLDFINENFPKDGVIVSLMSQYTPMDNPENKPFPELSRPITAYEKEKAIRYLDNCENITLAFTQEDGVVSESFIPDF